MIVNDFMKHGTNAGREEMLSFYRDKSQREVDVMRTLIDKVEAYEIKSGQTFTDNYFKNLAKWSEWSGVTTDHLHVIYGGGTELQTSKGKLLSWQNIQNVFGH